MSNALSDWQEMHRALGKAPDVETAESWHKVHAQLLKSVADAQAKLLAAQNETNDEVLRSGDALNGLRMRMDHVDKALADLKVLIAQTQETVRMCHGNMLDGVNRGLHGLTDLIKPPRRQVKRQPPQRKQRR